MTNQYPMAKDETRNLAGFGASLRHSAIGIRQSRLAIRSLTKLAVNSFVSRRLAPHAGHSVLLTFDDGPHPSVTPAVLDRLRDYGARAVFFVVGKNIARAPEMLGRIIAEGHLIGNHSYAHERGGFVNLARWRRDLCRCQVLIEEHSGERPALFRPPFGYLALGNLGAAWSLGLRTVTWSVDANDWRCRTSEAAEETAAAILRQAAARDIILLHDDNHCVLTVLDRILPILVSRQFDLIRGAGLLGDG